jgi:hypothetical protein
VRRHTTTAVAALVAFSLCAGASALAATPGPSVSIPMTDEQRLLALFAELDASLANVRNDPYLSATIDASGAMPEASIDHAVDAIGSLTAEELSIAAEVLDASPALAQIPGAMDDAVDAAAEFTPDVIDSVVATDDALAGFRGAAKAAQPSAMAAPAAVQSATYTDDCPSAGDPAALIIAVLVLNQLQSAAYAAVLAVPGVFAAFTAVEIPVPAKIILAVVYGVALAVYLALAQTLAVASDCASASGAAELKIAWPVAGPTSVDPPPGSPVPGSSQISVAEALATVGDVTTLLNSVSTNVALVAAQVTTLGTQATSLNTSLSCTSGSPAASPAVTCGGDGQPPPGSDSLAAASDARDDIQTTQGDVAVLRNTQHVILDKSNEQIDALAAFGDLAVRMEIEANLSDPGFQAVALFQLPAPNGYLDVVAVVTTEAVRAFGGGERELELANDAAAAGRYKDAYKLYHQAYQGALK